MQRFQTITQQFLAKSKAAGKKKLIIDLSANGGGSGFLAYDLFEQVYSLLPALISSL